MSMCRDSQTKSNAIVILSSRQRCIPRYLTLQINSLLKNLTALRHAIRMPLQSVANPIATKHTDALEFALAALHLVRQLVDGCAVFAGAEFEETVGTLAYLELKETELERGLLHTGGLRDRVHPRLDDC